MLDLSKKRKIILIGFLSKTIKGPIPIITNVYIEELKHKYDIIPFFIERTKGNENLAAFNITNLYYFIKQYISWCLAVIRNKAYIVHYPVTSYWNMEKSAITRTAKKITFFLRKRIPT